MNINKNSSICKIKSITIVVMFSSFLLFSMTSILLLFSLSTDFFAESTSDSVDCFSGTKATSKSRGMPSLLLIIFSGSYKALLPFFPLLKNFSGAVTFFDNESNRNLQTTISYRRWSVLWFSYSRLNKPSIIDKIMTKVANLVRCVSYDVKVCQFSWNISSNWHCERVVVISNFLSKY